MQAGVASRDQYETAHAQRRLAQQSIATAQQQVAQALANLGGAERDRRQPSAGAAGPGGAATAPG